MFFQSLFTYLLKQCISVLVNLIDFLLASSFILSFIQQIRHRIAVLSAFGFSLFISPFFFPWIIAVQTWRFFLSFVIRKRDPHLELVETRSLRTALDTRRWPGLAVAVIILEKKSDLTQLRTDILEIMQLEINKHSVLRRRLSVSLGCYVWHEDDTSIDANKQLIVWSKRANSEIQLQNFISSICSKKLPADRPPWQVVLIPCKTKWAVLLCAHHLIVDSLRPLVKLLTPTSCNLWTTPSSPLLRNQLATETIISALRNSLKSSITRLLYKIFCFPITFLKFIFNVIVYSGGRNYLKEFFKELWDMIKVVIIAPYVFATQLIAPVENIPLLRTTTSPGNRILAWSPPVGKELIKLISRISETSEVDILLAACAGTLRHFFHTSRAPVPESVSAILPLIFGERNAAGFALIDLPTGEWDPVNRLELVSKQMKAVQNRPLHILIGAIVLRYANYILPQAVLTLALNFLSRRHTITICFVDTPINAMPHLSRMFYWRPPQGNAGLTFTVQSNEDSFNLAVASNQSVLSKPPLLTSQFANEIRALAIALKIDVSNDLFIHKDA